MAFRSSTNAVGTAVATINIAVPASAATDDIAILVVNIDGTGHGTITWPSGFTLLDNSTVASPDGHTQACAWKRLTGADSGNYTVSWTGSNDVVGQCDLFSGRHTSNPPVVSVATDTTANSSPISVNATGVTAVAGDDLMWIGGLDATSNVHSPSCAPPSTFTERQDSVNLWATLSNATKDNVSAGATGTITGVYTETVTAGWLAHLVRIPAAGGAAAAPFSQTDWPKPQTAQFPTSLRTWTANYNKSLVGQDVFPPGRKGLVFEGPPKAARPAGPPWTSKYNDNLIGQDRFPPGRNGITFERPQPITWRREWTLNLLQSTLAPVVAVLPFRQQDWPLPQRSPQPDRTWLSTAAELQLRLPPPGYIYFELPPQPSFWRNGSTLNLVLTTLLSQDAFPPGVARTERPPPLDWRNGWTISLLQTTLAPIVGVPFAQYDWPLPRVASQPDRTFVAYFNPNLVGQDAFPPGVVRSERLAPHDWRRSFELNLLLSTLATGVQLPLNQYNWPIPGQSWQPPRTWLSSYNINLIGQDQLPFRQTEWPLPRGYFYPESVKVAVPLNINLFPPPTPPPVTSEYRSVKVAGGEFGFMGLRGGGIG